jgi:hypothetical protein
MSFPIGEGPFVTRADIKSGTLLMGMAPIGIRWEAKMMPNGRIKPDGNCPPSEFSLTHALINRIWHEVR